MIRYRSIACQQFKVILILFIDVFYHHRASAWGIKIQDNYLITGSMDKTISLINLLTLKVEKHFIAHEDEWGGKL